ncbi:MAG: NAD(P)/FAD-dependent oxidoreductase [Ramlibacter sp.]|uniref:NAD(P)-binding domain-containing protein n=1 Tax=Ramlibacter sp. TaxID=1917967 RepID=UPI0026329F93|nr:NAD(P)/FAD-dependent oxidoreductase [Ramlibacter sp.]MDB5752375.1 NAD(P)/FAD-dependent oxidoreductase [Ramlibacter sp.]
MNVPSPLPPVPAQSLSSPRDTAALARLALQASADLARLNLPPANWVLPALGPQGQTVLDVLVAGAGMCGQTAAYALLREGISNFRVIDRAARGQEGPWGTFARMLTLRSPKHLTGPDLGVPSLTFRAWYEAQHGERGWAALHKIGRLDWRDYLLWVRETVGLRVENRVMLLSVEDEAGLLRVRLGSAAGAETVWTRKLVLALGREGSGAPRWPEFPSLRRDDAAARERVFHSADAIDFQRWRGQQVAVLGAGASAFDNAACALEAGARVTLFARRPILPQVNKSKWTAFTGFFRGFEALDDARKWRIYTYIFDEQVPPPWETVRRCDAQEAFTLRLAAPWLDVRADADGVAVTTPAGSERFDAVIFGTGFDVDLLDRHELARYLPLVDTWANHVTAEQALAKPEPARFPYLGSGFELRSTDPAQAAVLGNMHLFNWGSTMSHGAIAGDIPGLAVGANRLAQAIARDLFMADADAHWERLLAHEEPELLPTRWYVPPNERS